MRSGPMGRPIRAGTVNAILATTFGTWGARRIRNGEGALTDWNSPFVGTLPVRVLLPASERV